MQTHTSMHRSSHSALASRASSPVFTGPPDSRPAYLMCAPELYEVDYVINPWMAGNVHRSSRDRALAQWRELHRELSRVAHVELVAPAAGWPDMVFTANAGLIRGREAILSSFFHPERQGEEPHFRRWLERAGYTVRELPRETPFEGEGDALFSEDGARLFVGHGPRTSPASHRAVAKMLDVEVVSLHLVDPRFYHLDTCFAPLRGGLLLYYPAAFDAPSLARIEATYPSEKRIAVSESDATRFACNAVNVGDTVILNTISPALRSTLEQHGLRVVELALDEFLKAGGAAKCLVLRLHAPLHVTEANAVRSAILSACSPPSAPLPTAAELAVLSPSLSVAEAS